MKWDEIDEGVIHPISGEGLMGIGVISETAFYGFYLKNSTIASAYGPGNVIVAVMIWIYYSTQAFLMGAVICRYWMDRDESRYRNNVPSTGCYSSGRP